MEAGREPSDLTELIDKLNRAQAREDVQEFMQVYNLGAHPGTVKVMYRQLAGDFMAECAVLRDGKKNIRRLRASGAGRTDALEALASKVAEFFYPAPS